MKSAADEYAAPATLGEVLSIPDDEPAQGDAPAFVDLKPWLYGDQEPERPNVAEMMPGRFLFYRGRLNEVHGEPATGKSNVLIAAANAVLREGGSVLYLDPEDTPRGFARRALGLGGDPDALAARCFYAHNPTPEEVTAAQTWAQEHCPDLVALDGLAESLAAEGLDENAPGDILQFFRERLRPFAEAGAAVVVADHVTKATEGRGRWARGSGAKLGRYDGLVLGVELGKAYTPEEPGFVRLRVAKDRNGGAGTAGEVLAEVHFTPGLESTAVAFKPPQPKEDFRPTAIMDKILAHLRLYERESKSGLCGAISSKKSNVLRAMDILVEEGLVEVEREGRTHFLKLKTAENRAQ